MNDINLHFSYDLKVPTSPKKFLTLTEEKGLIYNDDGNNFKGHFITAIKFSTLTAASPLISIARLVRAVAFGCNGKYDLAKREFIGALSTPLITSAFLTGTLLSSIIYIISGKNWSFYRKLRHNYAHFEAWVNKINLNDSNLTSYRNRVSNSHDFLGNDNKIWTTAPCMQPILENREQLFDARRIQKLLPGININKITSDQDNEIVIKGLKDNNLTSYEACGGAYERAKLETSLCCCLQINAIYDRLLCCEVVRGNCKVGNQECGITGCGACGLFACCCHAQNDQGYAAAAAIGVPCCGIGAGVDRSQNGTTAQLLC